MRWLNFSTARESCKETFLAETTLLHDFTNCIMFSMVPDKYVKSFQKAAINSVQDTAKIFVVVNTILEY
jgi:hypothetical protein